MFIDEVRVILKAGNGGNGCMSFRREPFRPKGGPDGGDGGDGGHVILLADENQSDLTPYKYRPQWNAEHGEHGKGSDRNGARGKHRYLKVPPGTVVFDLETDEFIAEVLQHGEEFVLLKGGKGGKGNTQFKSSTNQAPRQITEGTDGEVGEFKWILKTIADAGLVGFPNAGKSSLTGLLTKARRKIGAYPFTTISPGVGIVEYPDEHLRYTIADIPGLIEGAHQNRGLGHRFLRHIERCRLLIFIIDMAAEDERDPAEDYATLLNELECYDASLIEKPQYVLANKMDMENAEENLKKFKKRHPGVTVEPISCVCEEGLGDLRKNLLGFFQALERDAEEA